MRSNHKLYSFAILLLMVGCAVGPKYQKPSAPVPEHFKENYMEAQSDSPPLVKGGARGGLIDAQDLWKPANPADEKSRGKWWEIFNDPQLNELEERINVSNQSLKVAEAQYRQARALVRENQAEYYPQITTNPSVTASRISANLASNRATAGKSTTYLLPVDLSYEADVWGRVRKTVAASKANAQASAADLETVRLSLQSELAADYFALRALDAEKQLHDSTIQSFEKALQLTHNRHDAGIASGADVAQAETQLETTRAQATDITVQRAQLEHAIAVLIGQTASTFSLSSTPLDTLPPEIPPGLPSQLLERRPDIAGNERRVAAANAQIGVAQAAFFPSLLLNVSGGFEGNSLSNWLSWPSRFWSIGPALLQTIFDGGQRRAISDQAWAAYDQTVATYRENALTAFQEVEDNLAAIRILADEAETQERAIQAAQRSLQISTNQYQSGITSYLDVITAQTALLSNQRTALDILQRRMSASVLLIKAIGGGWRLNGEAARTQGSHTINNAK